MADVTLVLDNADGLLPVDYGVVELGRRLFRSGENEYLLNRQRVRLRDLDDLRDAAERAFSRALSGSCHTPLAAHAVFVHGELWLRGLLASRDGAEVMRGDRRASCGDPQAADALGRALADEFLARGAARLVAGVSVPRRWSTR